MSNYIVNGMTTLFRKEGGMSRGRSCRMVHDLHGEKEAIERTSRVY